MKSTPQIETWYHLSRIADNRKTGPIPVSTTTSNTCPTSCPFNSPRVDSKGKRKAPACYGKAGPLGLHWRNVNNRTNPNTTDLAGFCKQIAALPKGQTWRHNQAGDLPGNGQEIDAKSLQAITKANRGRNGFTYTHYMPEVGQNAANIHLANLQGFTINLSANNLSQADELWAEEIAPVVVVLPHNTTRKTQKTPAGRLVLTCPEYWKQGANCANCGLCQIATRKFIVGLPAHGTGKFSATEISKG